MNVMPLGQGFWCLGKAIMMCFFCIKDLFNYVTVWYATIFENFSRISIVYWNKKSWNIKDNFFRLVIIMLVNVHCHSRTAVTQVADKAHGFLVLIHVYIVYLVLLKQ